MAFQYKDTNDLIQNQRALAELVGVINEKFDLDEGIANTLTAKLNDLQASVDAYIASCNSSTNTHRESIQRDINTLNSQLADLKTECARLLSTCTTLGTDDQDLLLGTITFIASEIRGYNDEHNVYHEGIRSIVDRIDARFPTIQIFEQGAVPVEADRYPEVLYGEITTEVKDFEAGSEVRISPYLQGVIRELGKS